MVQSMSKSVRYIALSEIYWDSGTVKLRVAIEMRLIHVGRMLKLLRAVKSLRAISNLLRDVGRTHLNSRIRGS